MRWRFAYFKIELVLFLLLVIVNCSLLFITKYFPTHDGGAHLYNTNIIYNLLFEKNSIYSEYFKLSPEVLPNWASYIILIPLNKLVSFEVAEKIYLLIFLAFTPIVFRKLILKFNSSNPELSYTIFPFTHFSLFYMGFFNFSFGILMFLLTTLVYLNYFDKFKTKNIIFLFLCLVATYFSHIFCFITVALFIFSHFALYTILNFRINGIRNLISFLKFRALIILLFSSLIFYWIFQFFAKRPSVGNEIFLETNVILQMIFELRPLIAFGDSEKIFTSLLLYLIFGTFILILVYRIYLIFKLKKIENWLKPNDVFLIIALIFMSLIFIEPNEDGYGGYITVRLVFFMFVFILGWLATTTIYRPISFVLIGTYVCVSFFNLYEKSKGVKFLNAQIKKLEGPMKLVEENKILIPTYWASEYLWQGLYFNNYIAANKNIVILENYEADTQYFPVLWKESSFPYIKLGSLGIESSCYAWKSGPKYRKYKIVDYVLFYGAQEKNDCYMKLKDVVIKNYNLIYNKDDIRLYKIMLEKPLIN